MSDFDPFTEDSYFESEWREHQEYLRLIREYWKGLAAIKALCEEGEADRAKALWDEDFPELVRIALWKAPTRGFGSIFETWEREMLKLGDDCFTMPVAKALKFLQEVPPRRMKWRDICP